MSRSPTIASSRRPCLRGAAPTAGPRLKRGVGRHSKKVSHGKVLSSRSPSSLRVVLRVVSQMAPLAQGLQVLLVAVLWRVVEVSHRQHYARASHGVRFSILGSAVWVSWRAFAPLPGTFTHRIGNALPVARVARPVLRAYRRGTVAGLGVMDAHLRQETSWPNQALQPTRNPPLRSGLHAAELGRWTYTACQACSATLVSHHAH